MLPFTINLAPLVLSLFTGVGVLFHDTHLDRALITAPVSGYVASNEASLRGDDHVHTETVTENLGHLNSAQPRLQTRFTDEKKYLTPRKASLNTTFDGLS
jgi:hypothetical protein